MRKSTLVLIIILAVIIYFMAITILLSLLTRNQTKLPSFAKSIALIEVEGVIMDSRNIVRQIKKYSKNSQVTAIVLRVDSPGGGVSASQEIYSEIIRAKAKGKKIIVSMGAFAASGGYYISAPADIIVANSGTITGSIGVIMEFPILKDLLNKIGIKVEVVKSQQHKDIGSPFREISPKERALLQDVISSVYEQFISVIVENRGIPDITVREISDGRILSGLQAKEFGLVDTIGSLEDAIGIAAELTGIKGEPQVWKERKRIRIFDLLFGRVFKNLFVPKLYYIM
jgi:protease-4